MTDARTGSPASVNHGAVLKQGIVLPKEHASDPNLVFVHFGDSTANPDGRLDGGIWCHNMISGFVRFRDILNTPHSYGAYTPLLPYTPVMVLMGAGGAGIPMIIGFAPTNTNMPDPENRNELHVVSQSPKGSLISMDDKSGNIQLLYNKGTSAIVMGESIIDIAITDGDKSGRKANTTFTMNKGSFEFRLRDSTMKFDESGFFINFDDDENKGGSYVKITKKGIELHGEEYVKFTSKEQVTMKGSKMTLQGTKDASLNANHLKVGGKQLTSITGAQIDIRSTWTVQLTGLHVGLRAFTLLREVAPMKEGIYSAFSTVQTKMNAMKSTNHSIKTSTYALGSSMILQDGTVLSNMGLGESVSSAITKSTKKTADGVYEAFKKVFTAFLLKTAPISASQKIIADKIAGTSEPAQNSSGSSANAEPLKGTKRDKKSFATVAASSFSRKNTISEAFSTVSPFISMSKVASLTNNIEDPQKTSLSLLDFPSVKGQITRPPTPKLNINRASGSCGVSTTSIPSFKGGCSCSGT